MTSKVVTLSLKEAAEIFATIILNPNDNDITAIVKTLAPILMEIEYDPVENTQNLWGVIASDDT